MSNTELSEFFNLVSQEKNENKARLKEKISNPESDLANLFEQLETAHKETTRVSEEVSEEENLTEDDQNRLEVFSNLISSFDSAKEIPQEVLIEADPIVDELVESEEDIEDAPEKIIKTDNIIQNIVDTLDDMGERTQVKEEIDQISSIRKEFEKFKSHVQQHISNQGMSGAGSGEVRLEFLDDVQNSTAKVDGKFLKYSSSDGKWVGADASGSGSSAADDISAGDAAVNITTTSGNITIDAAANNTDIIFKGTDASSDITMLTLDGSEAGAATFNDKIVATELDISGNMDIDGTSNLDAVDIDGAVQIDATVTVGANDQGYDIIFYGDTASANMTWDTSADDLIFNGAAGLIVPDGQFTLGSTAVSSTAAELNLVDGITAGTVSASKAVIVDSNKDLTGGRNLTISGELDAATGDFSGNVDIDGTLEADAITVDGTTLAEYISDTAGGMVSSNTETGITVTYQDADNTIDFAIDAAQTTITSIYATDLIMGEDSQTAIDFGTANEIDFKVDNAARLTLTSSALYPVTDNEIDLGTSSLEFKDAYFDGTVTSDAFAGPLTGDVTGNADTATALATARTIHGVSFDGSANIDLTEVVEDTVGAMVSSNTETGLSVTYQDGDGTLDFAIAAAQTTITSLLATDIKIGEDDQTKVDFETANEIHFYADNAHQVKIVDGAIVPASDNDIDLGTSSVEFKDAYFDGTVTADAFAGPLTGDVTGTSSKVTVSDSTANTNFPVVFHDESDALLDDTGALRYNPSTGTLLVPNLNVAGTTTTVDTVTMEAANAVIFEGATADAHETTLSIVDPTADRTQYLINQSGYIPLLAAATTTAITSTPAELNLLDGSSANSVVNSKAVIYGSSGELAGVLSTGAQTGITSIYNTSLAIGYGSSHANIDFGTDNRITFDIDGTSQVILLDGVFRPTTDSDVDLGASAKYFKDAYIDTITTTGLVTAGGRLITDDATEATSTTDGSLQTDGGLSVVKDAVLSLIHI